MILFNKKELNAEKIKDIYKKLNNEDAVLLASFAPFEDLRALVFAGQIKIYNDFIYWHYYGSSADKNTLTDFKWILNNIFDDCKNFCLINKNKYFNICESYYDIEREKDNLKLRGL